LEYSDTLQQGLYLIIQPSGLKSWAVRYRHAGLPRKVTIGSLLLPVDLKEVRTQAKEVLQAVQEGRDPASEKKIERRQTAAADNTFEAVARDFIERHQQPKNRTWKQTAWYLGLVPDPELPDAADDVQKFIVAKGGLVSKWGDRKFADIRKADIIAAVD